MLSDVFNVLISAFSSNSSEGHGVRYPTSDGEDGSTAISTPPPAETTAVVGRERLSGEQDSLHDRPLKKTEDLLVRKVAAS